MGCWMSCPLPTFSLSSQLTLDPRVGKQSLRGSFTCKTFVGGMPLRSTPVERKGGEESRLGRGEVELQCDPEKISPFPKGCFGVGRPFRAVQIESIWQAFIPELNRPWMPLEVGVNRQGSFLQQRKTPKEANTCRLLDRGAPSFLGEWVLPFCREIFSASEHLSSHAWLLPADLWAFCLLFLLSGNFLFAIYLISLLHGKSLTRLNSLLCKSKAPISPPV